MEESIFQDYKTELSIIDISNPDFNKKSKTHDWKNNVPYEWQPKWLEFTEREQKIIAVMAQIQANNEEYP